MNLILGSKFNQSKMQRALADYQQGRVMGGFINGYEANIFNNLSLVRPSVAIVF